MPYHRGMTKQEAIERAGSVGALAKLLGVTSAAISQWGERVPDSRVWQLRVLKPEWFETAT
jgi:predicted transcriptional regulator